jgi:hypothetical protein
MADSDVLRGYQRPLNPRASITQADRPAVLGAVKKQLDDILNGPRSHFPDGVQITDAVTRLERLDRLIHSIETMRLTDVDDHDGVLADVADNLRKLHKGVSKVIDNQDRGILLDQSAMPTTRDRNEMYVSPDFGPYSPPNPLDPKNWNNTRNTSLRTLDTSDLSRRPFLSGIGDGQSVRSQRMAQAALPMQTLTMRTLQSKGVPEADIRAAINDPAQMRDLLNQLYGRGRMATANGNSGGLASRAGRGLFADGPDQASARSAAAADSPPPLGWAGLPALLR